MYPPPSCWIPSRRYATCFVRVSTSSSCEAAARGVRVCWQGVGVRINVCGASTRAKMQSMNDRKSEPASESKSKRRECKEVGVQ